MSDLETPRPIDRTPGIPGSDKNVGKEINSFNRKQVNQKGVAQNPFFWKNTANFIKKCFVVQLQLIAQNRFVQSKQIGPSPEPEGGTDVYEKS